MAKPQLNFSIKAVRPDVIRMANTTYKQFGKALPIYTPSSRSNGSEYLGLTIEMNGFLIQKIVNSCGDVSVVLHRMSDLIFTRNNLLDSGRSPVGVWLKIRYDRDGVGRVYEYNWEKEELKKGYGFFIQVAKILYQDKTFTLQQLNDFEAAMKLVLESGLKEISEKQRNGNIKIGYSGFSYGSEFPELNEIYYKSLMEEECTF